MAESIYIYFPYSPAISRLIQAIAASFDSVFVKFNFPVWLCAIVFPVARCISTFFLGTSVAVFFLQLQLLLMCRQLFDNFSTISPRTAQKNVALLCQFPFIRSHFLVVNFCCCFLMPECVCDCVCVLAFFTRFSAASKSMQDILRRAWLAGSEVVRRRWPSHRHMQGAGTTITGAAGL